MPSDRSLASKLLIRAGYKIAVLNSPPNYRDQLGVLPDGAEWSEADTIALDWVQVFVPNAAAVDELVPGALARLKPHGLLWVCYPKGSGAMRGDLNRDVLRAQMERAGQTSISLVAVDETWSAMRFRPSQG